MIYQCYFAPGQESRLFRSPLYRGFGLEPEVNPGITLNCPELKNATHRKLLTEYGAMLHLWRNPADTDRWIGFSSYRQLDKFPTIFGAEDRPRIEQALEAHDGVGWGFYRLVNATTGQPGSVGEISETCHPGITRCLSELLDRFGHLLPQAYLTADLALFANYWILPRTRFCDFMSWSYPMVRWCLDNHLVDPFLRSHDKSIGYLVERLFIIWYLTGRLKLTNLGRLDQLPFRDNGARQRIAEQQRIAG